MTKQNTTICSGTTSRKGLALLVTLAVLVILTTIVYSLSQRLKIYRRRQQYIINYQSARYACDSAMKYAIATANTINPKLITREETPDFSDLFYMTPQQKQEMLQAWAELKTEENLLQLQAADTEDPLSAMMGGLLGADPNSSDPNPFASFASDFTTGSDGTVDANSLTIPGPYGPPWPYVTEPLEFEIADTKVTIKIRDENARMPLIWMIMDDEKLTRAADDALESFCQWMRMDYEQIDALKLQLEETKETKFFSRNLKPIVTTEKKSVPSRTTRTRRTATSRVRTIISKTTRPLSGHTRDFAMLFHSSLIDLDTLSCGYSENGDKYEPPLNYLGLFGSEKVNINTAPRHVLQAAFTFGGNEVDIADAIITQRQIKPYKDIDEFKEMNYEFSDSIRKVEPYITTQSTFFAIEIVAQCGNATVSSIAAITKKGSKIEKIAYMSN